MKARITKCEVYDGTNIVNGKYHGHKWLDQWEVTFVFDSKAEAEKFAETTAGVELESRE